MRINDVIRAGKFGKGKIENALGKVGEKDCWGRISDWCDYSGPIDGKTAGLAVLADPKNAHPTFWHVRDYGLMAANPFGRKKAGFHDGAAEMPLVRLDKGMHLEMRYGILLHDGDAAAGQVAENYRRFESCGRTSDASVAASARRERSNTRRADAAPLAPRQTSRVVSGQGGRDFGRAVADGPAWPAAPGHCWATRARQTADRSIASAPAGRRTRGAAGGHHVVVPLDAIGKITNGDFVARLQLAFEGPRR